MTRFLTVALVFGTGAWAHSTAIVLDFSGSMAGFVNPGTAIFAPALERLGHIVSARSTVAFYGMSSPGGKPALSPLPMKEAVLRFRDRRAYRGDTPLLWALQQLTGARQSSDIVSDIVIVTDGMEEGGRIEKVASEFSRLVQQNWAIGFIALRAQFQGRYYPEEMLPVRDLLPKIAESLAAESKRWAVRDDPVGCAAGTCYHFDGERPVFFLLFSRSGNLGPVAQAVQAALKEHHLTPVGALQLAPAEIPRISVQTSAPKPALVRLKLPVPPENDFVCAQAPAEPIEITLTLRSNTRSEMSAPSGPRPVAVEVEERPDWVQHVAPALEAIPDGRFKHTVRIVCRPGAFWQQRAVREGRLRIKYTWTLAELSRGWWHQLSAENSWQYPFRAYKLAEVVSEVHRLALRRVRPFSVQVSYGMIVHR